LTNSDSGCSSLLIFVVFVVSYLISVSICLFMNIDPFVSSIISSMVGFSFGLITMVVKNWYGESKKNEENMKNELKNHKTDVRDKGLAKLEDMGIERDDFSVWKDVFEVKIHSLNGAEREKIHEQTIHHLKAYPDMERIWNNSKDKVKDLNIALIKLREYLSKEIAGAFKEEQSKLRSLLWISIEWANSSEKIKNSDDFDDFLKSINIETENNNIVLKSDGFAPSTTSQTFRKLNVIDVSVFLSDLIKSNTIFREQVKSFTIEYKGLKETFDNEFKKKVNGLLKEIKDDADVLEGKCDKCEIWVKKIG